MIRLKKSSISEVEVFSYEDKDLQLLDSLDNNMYLDIVIENIGQIPYEKLVHFLNLIHRKMRHGCLLSITGLETKLLFEKYNFEQINTLELNKILSENKFLVTSREIREILHSISIAIESININNIYFTIKGKRR
jgi:hypothetical protein